MPVHLTFTLDKVFLRAGTAGQSFAVAGQVRPARPFDRLVQFGVMAFWPKDAGWLRLSATATPDPAAAGGPIAFADTVAGLEEVCAAHAVRRDQFAPARFLEAHAFLVASLPQHNRVVFRVEVDTDADGFRRAVRDRRNADKGEFVQPVHLLFFDAKQFSNSVTQAGKLDLVMKPCVPVPRFDGVLAVDLGNTTTTAASVSEADPVYRTDSARLVPLEPAGPGRDRADPVLSVVRFDRLHSPVPAPEGTRRFPSVPADDRPAAVAFAAGEWVTLGAGGEFPPGVVYGAKQLLTVKDGPATPGGAGDPYLTLVVPHARGDDAPQPETVEVLDRVPGELLFTHVVRQFRQARSAWPPDLTLTYPTTYSPRELRQLVRAAARGWLRAVGQPQGFDAPAEPNEDARLEGLGAEVRQWLVAHDPGPCPLVGLTLDEATAAAFFHLYRRVFERPGGLLRFRYLHPAGVRLLLLDCGGGTTDIALVHAVSPPESPNLLVVDVLARTGVRAFGGDHITRQVCRLVKAKLALLLARGRTPAAVPAGLQPPPATAPPSADQARVVVEDFLARVEKLDPGDGLVPTRFDPDRPDATTADRRTAAHALWQLAERLKRKVGDGKAVRLKELGAEVVGPASPLVAAVLRPFALAAQNQLAGQIGEVAVAPWEVDALVRRPIEAAIAKCNRLIRKHLIDAPGVGREQEVDWVVLSGNGARYPLVPRLAREQLHVAYVADRLTVDTDNLKGAVAKGAAMARMVERVPRAVGIRFNRHLSELLPFDVGYHDMLTNQTEPLFREYTPYPVLAAEVRTVRLVLPGGATPGNTFVLERRFPGDDGYTPFAAYQFSEGIRGELEVRFDAAAGEFTVRDTLGGDGVPKDLAEADHHVAVLRGDI